MKSKESEYKELFLIEAKDNIEELDKLFVDLEKDHSNEEAINAIFRITHTLKGNAMGLGFEDLTELSHIMEDVMIAIKNKEITLGNKLFDLLFRANDKLGGMVKGLETGEKVSYLGIKSSLSIHLNKEREKSVEVKQEDQASEKGKHKEESQQAQEDDGDSSSSVEGRAQENSKITFSEVIQIPVKKMDDLLNQVGQLMIEKDRLVAISEEVGFKQSEFDSLDRITSNLQFSMMNARMVQIGFLFNKFHRIVRDAAAIEGKNVTLQLKGTDTEIDRNILKILSDSLVHLVRNSVSHGIEPADVRKSRKKPVAGSITLNAIYERDRVVITVSDDGGGIDPEIIRKKIVQKGLVSEAIAKNLKEDEVIRYIFESGFSNTDKVNEISGRGVGMDVVKKAVESIGGQVKIETQVGEGTSIILQVPSSLALKGTLLFEVQGQEYAVALSYTEAVVTMKKTGIHKLSGGLMANFQDDTISILFLKDILALQNLKEIGIKGKLHTSFDSLKEDEELDVVIVSYSGRTTGIVVDRVLQRKEIIEKPLAKPIDKVELLSGTTILGNGNVCPVIDIAVVTDLIHKQALQAQND